MLLFKQGVQVTKYVLLSIIFTFTFVYILSATIINILGDQPYWLAIAIGKGSEVSRRMQLTALSYNLHAWTVADSAITSSKISSDLVVKGINSITGDIILIPGENVRISQEGNSLIISSEITDSEEMFSKSEGSGQMRTDHDNCEDKDEPPFLFMENIFPYSEKTIGIVLESFAPLAEVPHTSDVLFIS